MSARPTVPAERISPASSQADSANAGYPWIPDQGGTFRNPVLFADYSDPDVIRVGDDYYLTASSFNCVPGLPILHSKDLVNWSLINHAVRKLPHPRYDEVQHGCGVWAPAIRFYGGRFWIFFAMPDEGIYVTTASDAAGQWSEPHLVQAGKGLIDPCPFWDDDGQAYLIHAYAESRAGIKHALRVLPMSPDGRKTLGAGKIVFENPQRQPTLEGPKCYKRNNYYYIFAPAGGVKEGWQTVLRSKNIFGPYEDRIVLAQGDTEINGPHQGAWVETPAGEHWFIHFQDCGAYGRIVHLQPMRWEQDWPVMGKNPDPAGAGEPVLSSKKPVVNRAVPIAIPQTGDEFQSSQLGLQWQWPANPRENWASLSERPGWLRLFSVPLPDLGNLWLARGLLLQKFPAPEFTITTRMDCSHLLPGQQAGLIITGADYGYLAIETAASGRQLVMATCQDAPAGNPDRSWAKTAMPTQTLFLRVHVRPEARCEFSFSVDGEAFVPIGKSFAAREGKWIGAKVGLFCVSRENPGTTGHADFEWFRYQNPPPASGRP